MKTIDLFAGCGGLTLGLHLAGHSLLFAVEKDPMAFETFYANFLEKGAPYSSCDNWPSWLEIKNHDIQEITDNVTVRQSLKTLKGQVDLVCGGPPCQGFSLGGIRDGKDTRNQLPYKYIEFVDIVKPKYLLLENVEGIAKKFVSKPGHVEMAFVEWMKNKFSESGYDTHFEILDASDYGVPQTRRRVFLFGVDRALSTKTKMRAKDLFSILESTRSSLMSRLGLTINELVTVKDAMDDLDGKKRVACPDSPKFESGTYKTPRSAYAKLMRRNIPNTEIPNSHRFSIHTERIVNFYKKVQQDKMFGRLPKTYLLAHGTKKDKKVLIDPSLPASTITTHPDEFIHFRTPRNITVREMARIQSFPDDFIFKGRYTINGERRRLDVARCSQVGNAVPPLLAEAIGLALHEFQRRTEEEK